MSGPAGPIDAQLSAIARSLLVAVARARRPFTRDELAVRWWPDAEPQRARASLSTVLWALRSALRDALQCEPFVTTRVSVSIAPGIDVDIDADEFEAALARGDDAAAELAYAGPYLRGIAEDEVEAERERLAALYEAALARLLVEDRDPERARRLIAADPYAEIAYRVLVDDALRTGASAAARAWMRRARSAFAEIGIVPALFREQPYQRILDVDGERTARTNLTSENTSFIGREGDLRILADTFLEARAVTILGAGGSGKTRLAREFAARTLGTRHSAVWFVDLTAFEGEGAVDEAIAAVLDVADAGASRATAIAGALSDTDALIVLDNCEHVIEQTAEITARIVRDAPLACVLATSREALRIEAEAIVPIEGLDPAAAADLFLTRARAADRRLVVDDAALACAQRIATALDGLPLAIELAAGRVRLDGMLAIAADALEVLSGALGPRDGAQRSQTIAASIAWSVERLDEPARVLFARLGVFAGTFDFEDGDAVDLAGTRALDRLIDRSLVVRTSPFEPHLRMLAPVRADARRRLESDPERDAVLDAYAERIRVATHAWIERRTGDAGAGAERALDALAGDIERALERLFANRADAAIDLVTALSSHWALRGSRTLAERWLARATDCVSDEKRRGDIAYSSVRFAHDNGAASEILRLGAIARDAYARAGDISGEAKALNILGSGYLNAQRIEESRASLERSLALQRECGDEHGVAVALANLAVCSVVSGDFANALQAYEECVPIFDRYSTAQARVKIQNNIAYVSLKLDERERSEAASDRALALAEAVENTSIIAFAAGNAAVRAVHFRDYARAATLARRVGELADAAPIYVAYALTARAAVAFAGGDDAGAHRFGSAARAMQRIADEFEAFEADLLAALPGRAEDAVDRTLPEAVALLRRS